MTEAARIVSEWLAMRVDNVDGGLREIIKNSVDPASKIAGDPTAFHTMVGYCIKEWASVEDALFATFHAACKIDLLQAAIIYYKTPSIDSRLTLADEIVQSVLPKPDRKAGGHALPATREWTDLKRTITNLLKVRNDIAHHSLYLAIEVDDQGDIADDARSWWQIAESHSEQQRGRNASKDPLELIDLIAHWIEVRRAHRALKQFNDGTLAVQISKPHKPSHGAGSG